MSLHRHFLYQHGSHHFWPETNDTPLGHNTAEQCSEDKTEQELGWFCCLLYAVCWEFYLCFNIEQYDYVSHDTPKTKIDNL